VIAAEKLTLIMDWSYRTTPVLFGDGRGRDRAESRTAWAFSRVLETDARWPSCCTRPARRNRIRQ